MEAWRHGLVLESSRGEPFFEIKSPPYIAIITEPDACTSDAKAEATYAAIEDAVSAGRVTLVSIRLSRDPSTNDTNEHDEVYVRALALTGRLKKLVYSTPTRTFYIVCSSDWSDLALETGVDGVHVKESHLEQIPHLRESKPGLLIGTSTHSIESAKRAWDTYRPDYYFVGTCFFTASHPEKTREQDLEGPSLPGLVKGVISANSDGSENEQQQRCPVIFAIGGLDETNCSIPVRLGADGVAVIRSILQAKSPRVVAESMMKVMRAEVRSQGMK